MNTDPGTRAAEPQSAVAIPGLPVIRAVVCAGGIETAYLRAGRGPPVLLLHGAGGGPEIWEPLFGSLSPHFRLIVPEAPEPQGSNPVVDGVAERSAWLRDFLDGLGIQRVSLVGSGEGGTVCLRLALEEPERVERLVLVGDIALDGRIAAAPQPPDGKWPPVLIIRGSEDDLFGIEAAEVLRRSLPEARMRVLPGAGDRSILEQALGFSEAVTPFLIGISR